MKHKWGQKGAVVRGVALFRAVELLPLPAVVVTATLRVEVAEEDDGRAIGEALAWDVSFHRDRHLFKCFTIRFGNFTNQER